MLLLVAPYAVFDVLFAPRELLPLFFSVRATVLLIALLALARVQSRLFQRCHDIFTGGLLLAGGGLIFSLGLTGAHLSQTYFAAIPFALICGPLLFLWPRRVALGVNLSLALGSVGMIWLVQGVPDRDLLAVFGGILVSAFLVSTYGHHYVYRLAREQVRTQVELLLARARTSRARDALEDRNLQLHVAYARARAQASRDPLTKVANRGSFDKVLTREVEVAREGEGELALLLGDIDHFKWINDRFGHQRGDECLTRVAEAITRSVRQPIDFVARYGGEEFAIILPGSDRELALKVADRIRRAVASLGIPAAPEATSNHLTMSFGVATPEDARAPTPDALVAAADRALYYAKESGRDRVVSASFDALRGDAPETPEPTAIMLVVN